MSPSTATARYPGLCPGCGIRPPSRDKQGRNKGECPECKRAREGARYRVNPEVAADRELRRKFGISMEHYNEMLERQGYVCAICRSEETYMRGGTVRKLSVDHDHETGAVRGLLCSTCNTAIGLLGDHADVLRAAAEYVENA